MRSPNQHDLDSVEDGRKEIAAQIKAVEKRKPEEIESPISVSLELQELRQSDKPEQRTLADVLSMITQLRTSQEGLEKRLASPEAILPPPYLRALFAEYVERISGMPERVLLELDHLLRGLLDADCVDKKSKSYAEFRGRLDHLSMLLRHGLR